MPSENRLERAEKESKRRPPYPLKSASKALEYARKEYRELMEWAQGIVEPKDLRERFGKIVGTDASYTLPACCEEDLVRRLQIGGGTDTRGISLRMAMWHILDHD